MIPICPPLPPPPPPQTEGSAAKPAMPIILDTDLTTVVDVTKARNIAPNKIDKSIWHLQDSDRVLKRGPNVKVEEADALRFIASSTQVPVPEVFGAYEKDGYGNIFMSMVIGVPLYDVLHSLDEIQFKRVVEQLSGFVKSWMDLGSDYFGSVGFKPCRDVFFQHLPAFNNPDREYGPFRSRTEYFEGLVDALQNSRPNRESADNDGQLIQRLRNLAQGPAVFCHGDLHPDNILVDDQLNIVGILDMGVSGFSIHEREYFETKSRARDPVWSSMVDRIIPKIPEATYSLLLELERELVRYSGI